MLEILFLISIAVLSVLSAVALVQGVILALLGLKVLNKNPKVLK